MRELKEIFEVGGKYTLYKISESMAMTHKTEIKVKAVEDDRIIFSKPRGRKRFILPFETRHYQGQPLKPFLGAIFAGWDQPIKCDSETYGVMRGNACYNFEGSVEEIRDWIESGQLNPAFNRSHVLAVSTINDDSEQVVFPEEYKGGHAIIDRLLQPQTV